MIIDNKLLDKIMQQAEMSPRKRMNFNLHDSHDAKAQRLINVLLPGTEMPVHRHTHSSETFIILRGRLDVMFYNDAGEETERFRLDASIGNFGLQIPLGQWHSIDVLEPTAIIEVKDGPYTPLSPENIL